MRLQHMGMILSIAWWVRNNNWSSKNQSIWYSRKKRGSKEWYGNRDSGEKDSHGNISVRGYVNERFFASDYRDNSGERC